MLIRWHKSFIFNNTDSSRNVEYAPNGRLQKETLKSTITKLIWVKQRKIKKKH